MCRAILFFTAVDFDQVQFIGINLRFKHSPWSISFSPAVIGFLVFIIIHKFKLSNLYSIYEGSLMTFGYYILISSYFEPSFIPFDIAMCLLIVTLEEVQCCDKCYFSPRHKRSAYAGVFGVNMETCFTVNMSPRCVSACELQDPTARATFRTSCCPHIFHTPTSLCVTPPNTHMHHRVIDA